MPNLVKISLTSFEKPSINVIYSFGARIHRFELALRFLNSYLSVEPTPAPACSRLAI
jgi:hypothetical protein